MGRNGIELNFRARPIVGSFHTNPLWGCSQAGMPPRRGDGWSAIEDQHLETMIWRCLERLRTRQIRFFPSGPVAFREHVTGEANALTPDEQELLQRRTVRGLYKRWRGDAWAPRRRLFGCERGMNAPAGFELMAGQPSTEVTGQPLPASEVAALVAAAGVRGRDQGFPFASLQLNPLDLSLRLRRWCVAKCTCSAVCHQRSDEKVNALQAGLGFFLDHQAVA